MRKKEATIEYQIDLAQARGNAEIEQQLLLLENMINEAPPLRIQIYELYEALNQASGIYQAAVEEGNRMLYKLARFRIKTAAQVQEYRYRDMAFRIFRNDVLQKYKAQFDIASRYVYLAAKAYDF